MLHGVQLRWWLSFGSECQRHRRLALNLQHHGALLRAQGTEVAHDHHHEVELTVGRELQIVRLNVLDVEAFAFAALAGVPDRVG